MNKFFTYSLIFVISILSHTSFAQKGPLGESISKINKMLKGIAEVSIKKENIIVKFTKNGQLYREDKVALDDLDPKTVEYIAEEKAVVLRCYPDRELCFDRKFLLKGRKNYYSRLNIVIEKNESIATELVKELIHMIDLYQED